MTEQAYSYNLEIWAVIPLAPKYEASNLGRIRNRSTLLIARQYVRRNHQAVNLWIGATKDVRKKKSFSVHRLIFASFYGEDSIAGKVIRHLDDIKTNNRLENLAAGTHMENSADMIRNGNSPFGENNRQAKLSEAQVNQIRSMFNSGQGVSLIARQVQIVSRCQIHKIVSGKRWRHVHAET